MTDHNIGSSSPIMMNHETTSLASCNTSNAHSVHFAETTTAVYIPPNKSSCFVETDDDEEPPLPSDDSISVRSSAIKDRSNQGFSPRPLSLAGEIVSPFSQALYAGTYEHLGELTDNTLSKIEKRSKHLSCSSVMEFSDLLKQAGVNIEELQDGDWDYDTDEENELKDHSNTDSNHANGNSIVKENTLRQQHQQHFLNVITNNNFVEEYDSDPETFTATRDSMKVEVDEYDLQTRRSPSQTFTPPPLNNRKSMSHLFRFSSSETKETDGLNLSRSTMCDFPVGMGIEVESPLSSSPQQDSSPTSSDASPGALLSVPTQAAQQARRSSVKRKKSIRSNDFMKGGRYMKSKDFFSTLFKKAEVKEFGVDLLTVMSRKSEMGHEIPALIEEMMVVISERLSVEGLFRIGGSVKDMEILVKKMDSGKVVELRTLNIHVVTGLTKKYIRQAKLIPHQSYHIFKKIAQIDNETEVVKELSNVFRDVSVIPYYNCLLLNRLLHLLYNIHCKSNENQMTASNLAIIFAPNLFQEDPNASSTTLNSSLVLQTKGTRIITILIEKYQDVFRDLFEKIKANKDFIPLPLKDSISKNESKHSTTSNNNSAIDNTGFIIMKGFLSKKTKVTGWKRRFIVLTKTHVMVLEDEDTSKKALNFLDLSKSCIESNYEKKDFTFKICLRTDAQQTSHDEEAKEIILKAESETERNQWFNSIRERIEALQANQAIISTLR
ncbi:hypothetical protein C9374_000599 [Naegleria lovaniensis]|uniref:Rho GTPase activating protein n=1 Tax=Naegleria lovaniensis TaxID=51637 RepID=A0AA88KM02_NAELO|nr:uncharacterized protein C9374_000599 [Naegleria lovaniensis]KAG2388435.1 hypothetical protein C9374_000599 [Naegleria lovaniensis]